MEGSNSKGNKPIYSKSTNILLKFFGEGEFVKQYDFLLKQLKTSKLLLTLKKYNTYLILVQQKLDNLKSNLKKQIKETEIQTFDQIYVYSSDSSAKSNYQIVLKTYIYICITKISNG